MLALHQTYQRLERLVGTWRMNGRTLDAESDNIFGEITIRPIIGGAYPGLPPLIKPPHALFGQMLLHADHLHRAAEQCAVALRRHPNRARALLGSARAHTQPGDTQAAANAYTQFRRQWRSADGQ